MAKKKFSTKKKWISTDAWRGYEKPISAIASVTDTGNWEDSPSPTHKVKSEIADLRNKLKKEKLSTRMATGKTSNVFAGMRYLIAPVGEEEKTRKKVKEILKKNKYRYVGIE